jgi:hypothetical protein
MNRVYQFMGRLVVRWFNRHNIDVVPVLRWTKDKPKTPGLYIVRDVRNPADLPVVLNLFCPQDTGWVTAVKAVTLMQPHFEYAGPITINEPQESEGSL